jgi:hypothetical protein
MGTRIKLRRGTSVQHSSFIGADTEITVDTTNDTIVIHDGVTAGGHPVLLNNFSNVAPGSILDGGVYIAAPTYAVTPSVNSINEGGSVTYTVTTENVSNGTTLYWTNSGSTIAADFSDSANSGSFTITSNSGTITRTLSADATTEGSETIIIQIRTGSSSGTLVATASTVTVNDTSTVSISPSVNSLNEGNPVVYSVATAGVSDGTTLYWTNSGTTTAADFTEGGSIKFVSGQTVTVPNNEAFAFSTGDFTVEAWVYINPEHTGTYTIFNVGPAGAGSYALYWLSSTQKFQTARYGDTAGSGTTTNTYAAGQWYHVAAVRSSGTAKLYINGVADSGSTYTPMGIITATTSVSLGASFGGSATNNGYTTNLRVVKGSAVYSANFTPSTTPLSVITNTSLLLNVKSSTAMLTDSSAGAFTLTNSGSTFDNTNPFAGGSIKLNGTSQYLSYANNSAHDIAGSDFTIEFFAKLNSTSGAMISKYGASNSGGAAGETSGGYGWLIQYTSSVLKLVTGRGSGSDQVMTFAWTPATGTWYHIAISRSGTNVKAFVDGIQIGSTATQLTPTYDSLNQLQVGKTHTTAEYLNGNITNVRLIKGTALYTATFTAPTAELTAVANTSLLLKSASSAGMLVDSSTNAFTFTNNATATWSPITPVTSSLTNGSFTVYDNSAIITRTFLNDLSSGEGNESLILNVKTTSISGTTVATASTVTVNDTSLAPTYAVTPSVNSLNEGGSVTYTVTTENVSNGTTLYWTNSGTIVGADFSDSANSGSFTITSNSGTITRTLAGDFTVEDSESLILHVRTASTSGPIVATASTVTVSDIPKGSIAFNGSNQYLSYANNSAHNIAGSDFTIEFWVRPTVTSGGIISKYGAAISTGGAAGETSGGYGWLIQYTSSALRLVTGLGGTSDQVMSFAWAPAVGTWYHVAIARSGTSVKAFINGTQIGSTATQTTPTYASLNPLHISHTHTSGYPGQVFSGNITNVRLIKGTALYTTNFTPSTAPLTAVTNTTLLLLAATSGTLLTDSSTNNLTATNNNTATWSSATPLA